MRPAQLVAFDFAASGVPLLDATSYTNNTLGWVEQGSGGDIVLSEALAQEPAVAVLLQQWKVERGSSQLKGISGETAWARIDAVTLVTP